MPLTDMQVRFIEAYLIDPNATKAAIAAGYSPATAGPQGSRLLTHVEVRAELERRRILMQVRTGITPEMVIAELAKIGFSDIRQVVRWRSITTVDEDAEPGEMLTSANEITIIDSDGLDEKTAGAIAEVSQTKDGTLKVKLYDKPTALVRIGQHLGMFRPVAHPGAPGKKEQAQADAETAGTGTGWGDDLDTAPTRVN